MVRISLVFAGCLAFAILARSASAGYKPGKRDMATAQVDEVLRREMAGPTDRRSSLADILAQKPDLEAARWQSGYIRLNKAWRSYESARSPVESAKLEEYREQRTAATVTGAGQLALADWCRKQGLVDQERAHLNRALGLSPELFTSALLHRLGFRQVGGQWLSREQCDEWAQIARQAARSIEMWEPRLTRATQKFLDGQNNRATVARQLKQIVDPSAVPAIEYLLGGQSQESAELAVDVLRNIDGFEGSQSLARLAAFSNWPQVRQSAALALKTRKFEDFVPPLIRLLSTPVTAEFKVSDAGVHQGMNAAPGALFYSLVLARETIDQFQVATIQTINLMADDYLAPGSRIATQVIDERVKQLGPTGIDNGPAMRALARGRTDAVRTMQDQLYLQRRTVEEYNERTAELNGQIGGVLATVSGLPPTTDPKPWWDWWLQFADLQQLGDKTVVKVSETYLVGNPAPTNMYYGPVRLSGMGSCFAAGTPVWTETGLMPIEQIAVGDRVLSKDLETGELAYKPVVQTTVRPPKELYKLRLAKETIVCTGGHRFWVSGAGWVKARDLQSENLLHTVIGSNPVETEQTTQTEETYNLVVSDFHTYFVGQNGILAQDLLLPKPTNKRVPGLFVAPLVAKAR